MSLPLTRRIARVVLLVAAGAAPVVGAAGSACAADLPAAPGLGGVTALDGANVGGTAQHVTGIAGKAGGDTVEKALPGVGKAGTKATKKAAPAARKVAGGTAGQAGGLVGGAAKAASGGGLPTDSVARGDLPTGQLPTQGLQVG
ncbi:ATP-binding protein [Streptomyces sp. AHU1]|uniref:ATP-binding protein n=1 Tax=Streptomyces sp. AHU1 TaxID=3377215 RepID=UPI003877C510